MANAPILGSGYLEVAATPANPPNKNEQIPQLDPAFMTAWNQSKYPFPAQWAGDPDFIVACANLSYRYKSGTGVTTPNISTISPTTTAHNVAFTLTVNGTNFDASAGVLLGNVKQPLGSSTPTQLTAPIPASAIATAGTYTVTVRNSDGSVSNSVNLTVT